MRREDPENARISTKGIYSLGYSLRLYMFPLLGAWKARRKWGFSAPLGAVCKRLVATRRSAAAMLKNEPPHSFFAADLLVACADVFSFVVLQVIVDLVTLGDSSASPLVACKESGCGHSQVRN